MLPGVPVLLAVLPLPGRAPQQDSRQLAHGGESYRITIERSVKALSVHYILLNNLT